MIASDHRTQSDPSGRSLAQLERDAALSRVSRVRRALIVGVAALTAGFAALVSAITPGRSVAHTRTHASPRTTTATTRSSSTTSRPKMPPLAGPGALGLQGPSSVPQSGPPASASQAPAQAQPTPAPSQAPAPPVSGGS